MKSIYDFNITPQPLWSVSISDDPITGGNRIIESDGLIIMKDVIRLPVKMYQTNSDYEKLEGVRFYPIDFSLDAFNDSRGPFINPDTLQRVIPDANGMVPNDTILRYTAIIKSRENPVVVDDLVLSFIQAADANEEFNI